MPSKHDLDGYPPYLSAAYISAPYESVLTALDAFFRQSIKAIVPTDLSKIMADYATPTRSKLTRDGVTVSVTDITPEDSDDEDGVIINSVDWEGECIRGSSWCRGSRLLLKPSAGFAFVLVINGTKGTIEIDSGAKCADVDYMRADCPLKLRVHAWGNTASAWLERAQAACEMSMSWTGAGLLIGLQRVRERFAALERTYVVFTEEILHYHVGSAKTVRFEAVRRDKVDAVNKELGLVQALGEEMGHEFVWV